jgi:hypothetical protein
VQGLTDRSRRPYRQANQLPFQAENFILNVKREHSGWGAHKIRERRLRRFSSATAWSSAAAACVVGQLGRGCWSLGLRFCFGFHRSLGLQNRLGKI